MTKYQLAWAGEQPLLENQIQMERYIIHKNIVGNNINEAIVSREFNIPCVVGCKVATQILHDGDIVELDANQGKIRILSRK